MKLESLEELRVFVQIVESGSMASAARALGWPPNKVSRRLAALEERLDTTLLYRTTRSLSLSDSGRALLARARTILREVEAAEVALLSEREALIGTVKVSVPSLLSADLLPTFGELMARHPGLRIQVVIHDAPVNPVTEGIDLLIIGGFLDDSALVARRLTDVQTALVASEDYIARRGMPRTLEELREHDCVVFMADPPLTSWTLFDTDGVEHTVPVQARFESDDGRTLMDALASGLGIGLTSSRIIEARPNLVRVLPGFRSAIFPLYAVYPAGKPRDARLQTVLSALHDVLVQRVTPFD